MKAETALDAAIKHCGGHLGDLVSWQLRASEGVSREALVRQADVAGLDPNLLPKDPTPDAAIRRAVKSATRRTKGIRVEKISDDPGAVVWAVSHVEVSADAEVGDSTAALTNRVAFLRAAAGDENPAGTIAADVDDDPFVGLVRERFEHYMSVLVREDLFLMIQRCLRRWHAVSLPALGQYFVGPKQAEELRALRDTLRGVGSHFAILPLPSVPEAEETIGDAAFLAFANEVEKIQAEVTSWQSAKMPRQDTLSRRLEALSDLRGRIDRARDMIGNSAEDLDRATGELTQAVKAMVSGDKPPPPPPEVKPPSKPKVNDQVDGDPKSWPVKRLRRELKALGVASRGLNKVALISAYETAKIEAIIPF